MMTDTAAQLSLAGLAAVVIVVLLSLGQPVIAGAVLLVAAVLLITSMTGTAAARREPQPRATGVERFCVSGTCAKAPTVTVAPEALLMAHHRKPPTPAPAPVVAAPAPIVHVVHVDGRGRSRRGAKRRRRTARDRDWDASDDDDDAYRREGYQQQQQYRSSPAPMRAEEEDDMQGWVRGMAPQRPQPRRPHPSQSVPAAAANPKSMVNADTDGNPATCGLVIRDHFRPGGDQAMVLKPRFGGWRDPGLGTDTSTPRKAMEAQRQVFQRNLLGYRNALLWPMYQSTEYQLRGINGRANVYDCGGSSYTGAPGVPIFNG